MDVNKQQDLGQKLVADGFAGPVEDRKCTDVLFGLLLIICWICMTGIGIDAIQDGDPYLLIAGVDYEGNVCGYDSGVQGLPNLYYVSYEGYGVCIADCPDTTDTSEGICLYGYTYSSNAELAEYVDDGICMYQYESTDILNYCVFDDDDVWAEFNTSEYGSYLSEFMADMYTAAGYIFGFGFAVAIVMGFFYVYSMRIPGFVTLLVWICIFAVLALFLGLGAGLYMSYKDWKNDDPETHEDYEVTAALVLAIICWVCAGLWACLASFLRTRIELAIGVIKEASRAVACMPVLIVWPLLQIVGFTLFLVIWVFYAIYTASLGTYDAATYTTGDVTINYKSWSYSDNIQQRGWFLLFCLFWTAAFIIAFGELVIALAVSLWYFTRNKDTIGNTTVFKAIHTVWWYHLGTAAFGSLIIAIIQICEAVISYFKKKAEASGNKLAEYTAICCACCFWCLEKCMKFINKNAYIQTAIFSTPFCTSAKRAFNLILRNIARVGAVTVLSEFVLTIMTLFITLACGGLSYLLMAETIEDKLNSIVGPVIMVMIIAYFTSAMFVSVYGMSIDTILMCFIADEEMFDEPDRYAQHDLKEWIHEHGSHETTHAPGRATANASVGSATPQREVKP